MRVVTVLALVLFVAGEASAQEPETTLKKRFEERYLPLLRLKDQGKIGETSTGYAEAVEPRYLAEQVDPGDRKSSTISKFLGEENVDRRKLYVLIARRSSAQEELVARRNARRLFSKAAPHHYLKLPDGRWVQKRDLAARTEQRTSSRP